MVSIRIAREWTRLVQNGGKSSLGSEIYSMQYLSAEPASKRQRPVPRGARPVAEASGARQRRAATDLETGMASEAVWERGMQRASLGHDVRDLSHSSYMHNYRQRRQHLASCRVAGCTVGFRSVVAVLLT